MIRKVGICGTGRQAERHLSYFVDNKYVVAGVKGASKARIEHIEESYRIPVYSGVRDLLNVDQVDLIVVASKPNEHKTDVLDAINGGVKYLIIEKPLAASADDAREIRDIIKQNNVIASVVYSKRFQKPYRYLKSIIEKKKYGALNGVSGNISFPRHIDPSKYPFKWWVNKDTSGGGAVFQVGIHWINFIFGLAGYPMELKTGNVQINEHSLEDALTAVWVSDAGVNVNVFMTSALPQSYTSIAFHFDDADVIYHNDIIIPIVKNNRRMRHRNPLCMLKRLLGKKSYASRHTDVAEKGSPTHRYLASVLDSELGDAESVRLLDDSISDIDILHEIINAS